MTARRPIGPRAMALWLLLPHAVAIAGFAAAFAATALAGTNRTLTDAALAQVGVIGLVLALPASLAAIAIAAVRRALMRAWPLLLAHVALFAFALWLGGAWIAHHLA